MTDSIGRALGARKNELARSMGALLGIAQGLLCDGQLNDREIEFLHDWLRNHHEIAVMPPASIVFTRVSNVLQDGVITASERDYLVKTLEQLIGAPAQDLAQPTQVMTLAFDDIERVLFPDALFCLTGEFVYGEREQCEELIRQRGGIVGNVTKKLNYLVVGQGGSVEWKHGSFGTKIAKALDYKQRGVPINIVAEHVWATSLSSH